MVTATASSLSASKSTGDPWRVGAWQRAVLLLSTRRVERGRDLRGKTPRAALMKKAVRLFEPKAMTSSALFPLLRLRKAQPLRGVAVHFAPV